MTEIDPFDAFAEKMAKVEIDNINETSNLFSSEGDIEISRDMSIDELAEVFERVTAQAKALSKAKSNIKQYLADVVRMKTRQVSPGFHQVVGTTHTVQVTLTEQFSFNDELARADLANGQVLPPSVTQKFDMSSAKIAKLDQQSFDEIRKYLKQKDDKIEVEVSKN